MSEGFWIDVIADGKFAPTDDFTGAPRMPRAAQDRPVSAAGGRSHPAVQQYQQCQRARHRHRGSPVSRAGRGETPRENRGPVPAVRSGWSRRLGATAAPIGSMPYVNHRDPPPYLPLSGPLADDYALGHAVFNTDFLAVGTPVRAAARVWVRSSIPHPAMSATTRARMVAGRSLMDRCRIPWWCSLKQLPAADSTAPPGCFGSAGRPGVRSCTQSRRRRGLHGGGRGASCTTTSSSAPIPMAPRGRLRQPHYELTQLNYGPLATNTRDQAAFGTGSVWSGAAGGGAGKAQAQAARAASAGRARRCRSVIRPLARWRARWASPAPIVPLTTAPLRKPSACSSAIAETPEMSGELLNALLTFEKWLSVPQNPMPPDPAAAGCRFETVQGHRLLNVSPARTARSRW